MTTRRKLVFIGLTLSSSWGNGHATTYRSLLRGLHALGHELHFFEQNVPWYKAHRDCAEPDFCHLHFYDEPNQLPRLLAAHDDADALIIGSYVPNGPEVIEIACTLAVPRMCFYDIDTPVTLAKLRAGDEAYLARRQVPLFDIYFSFAGGPVLDILRAEFGARRPVPLFCSVDPEQYVSTGEPSQWDLGYLGTYSADRQPTLERLLIEPARRLPECRFVVAGPQYPADIDWPDNVERIEHLPPSKHPSFYSRQRFTLNVTRSDMVEVGHSPSVRIFEAAACGTPIISDRWPGLSELLPEERAVLIADAAEDVLQYLAFDETQRQDIANAAWARVLSWHTSEARARELIASIEVVEPCQPSDHASDDNLAPVRGQVA